MLLTDIIKRRLLPLLAVVAAVVTLTGCDGMIYDDEGDCDPRYKVRFVFDKNLSFADAFSNEVNSVTLYIIDPESGRIVWGRRESGEKVKADGYLMDVDIAPGTYNLIAWCGDGVGTHFGVPSASVHSDLTCTLVREHDATGTATVSHNLNRLYHGRLDNAEFVEEEGTHVQTINLTKNTNDVNVVLQNLSGKLLDKNKFTFTVTDANGSMDWDNSIMPDEKVTYKAYDVVSGTAGLVVPDYNDDNPSLAPSRAITSINTCVASISTGRLMADRRDKMLLTVYNDKGGVVASVPLIDYALMVKGRYKDLEDQDYLDRQDKYDVVFFLDERDDWIKTHIFINSWKVVLQDAEL